MHIVDDTPPASITGLNNLTTEQSYIHWTWTDPKDADFAEVMIYLNGTLRTNVSKDVEHYNATGLDPGNSYTIGTHTVDDKGNINQTWENDTAWTPLFLQLQRINVTQTSLPVNIRESRNFTATGFDNNNSSMHDLVFEWYTTPLGIGTLNNSTSSVVAFTALHAGRTEIYAVNGSVSSNETYKVWVTVNALPETKGVANGTGNATSGNSTAIVNLNNGSVSGTITIEEIGDPINGTEDLGNRIGISDSKPVKGVNVTVPASIAAALKDPGSYVHIRVEYNESQLGGIDENTLYLFKFVDGTGWVRLVAGKPSYCAANGRNTTAKYVWVNVTECSIFLLTDAPPTPTPSGSSSGGGSGGTYPPGWFDTSMSVVTAATATVTAAPPSDNVTPASAKAKPAAIPPTTKTSTRLPNKGLPEFTVITVITVILVIVGLLAVAYAMMWRRG